MKQLILVLTFIFALNAKANNIMFGTPVAVTATSSSAKVMEQNGLRKYLLIVNTGAVPVYVKFGAVQSGTEGVPIPAGGNYEPIQSPSNSVYVVTASSTSTMMIIEGQ